LSKTLLLLLRLTIDKHSQIKNYSRSLPAEAKPRSYRSASSSPSARRPSSGFHVDNEKADARENVVVADRHANVRAKTDDNDDDADDGNFDDTLGEILGASFRVTPSLDLDLTFGAVDSNVDLACTRLLPPAPTSHLPSPLLLLLLLLGSPSGMQDFSIS